MANEKMNQKEVMKAIKAIEFHLVFLNPRLTDDFREKNEAVMALAKELREHLENEIVGMVKGGVEKPK